MLQGVADLREASTCSDCKLEHYLTHLIQTSQHHDETGRKKDNIILVLQIGANCEKLRIEVIWQLESFSIPFRKYASKLSK